MTVIEVVLFALWVVTLGIVWVQSVLYGLLMRENRRLRDALEEADRKEQ